MCKRNRFDPVLVTPPGPTNMLRFVLLVKTPFKISYTIFHGSSDHDETPGRLAFQETLVRLFHRIP